jgi:hypothetical protein
VSRVGPILGEASVDELVGDALHPLSGHSHPARDLGHAVGFVEDSAEHPPFRCRDATRPREAPGDVHEPAVELEGGDDEVCQRVARLRPRRRFGPLLPRRDFESGFGGDPSYVAPRLCISAGKAAGSARWKTPSYASSVSVEASPRRRNVARAN